MARVQAVQQKPTRPVARHPTSLFRSAAPGSGVNGGKESGETVFTNPMLGATKQISDSQTSSRAGCPPSALSPYPSFPLRYICNMPNPAAHWLSFNKNTVCTRNGLAAGQADCFRSPFPIN